MDPIGDHDESIFGEFLEDHPDDDPLTETNREALRTQIDLAMETLNDRESTSPPFRRWKFPGLRYSGQQAGV